MKRKESQRYKPNTYIELGKRKRTNPVRRKRCDRFNIALKHEYNFNRSIDTTMVCAENQYNNAGSCPGDSGKLQCLS